LSKTLHVQLDSEIGFDLAKIQLKKIDSCIIFLREQHKKKLGLWPPVDLANISTLADLRCQELTVFILGFTFRVKLGQ
jgi:hypothetical protein